MSTSDFFLRGSGVLTPANHIVSIETRNGSRIFRRVSMTAEQMAQTEARLMELQHSGEIRSYLLAGANDASFSELLQWLADLASHPQQGELINVQQNTLFMGVSNG